jgi:uncharacterized glyoxalase superfamily protein PhnB
MTPHFAVIELVVADMTRSLAFYRLLGFDLPAAADGESHVEAVLPGGLKIAWDTVDTIRSFDPAWSTPAGGHRIGLAFDCQDPADVDRLYAQLTETGHAGHLPPWNAFWGMRYAVVHDPDGNPVDLFASLPAAA